MSTFLICGGQTAGPNLSEDIENVEVFGGSEAPIHDFRRDTVHAINEIMFYHVVTIFIMSYDVAAYLRACVLAGFISQMLFRSIISNTN
jgi:hypothetical protein